MIFKYESKKKKIQTKAAKTDISLEPQFYYLIYGYFIERPVSVQFALSLSHISISQAYLPYSEHISQEK